MNENNQQRYYIILKKVVVMVKIVILDRLTLGKDLDISGADKFGEVIIYDKTEPYEVEERIKDYRSRGVSSGFRKSSSTKGEKDAYDYFLDWCHNH